MRGYWTTAPPVRTSTIDVFSFRPSQGKSFVIAAARRKHVLAGRSGPSGEAQKMRPLMDFSSPSRVRTSRTKLRYAFNPSWEKTWKDGVSRADGRRLQLELLLRTLRGAHRQLRSGHPDCVARMSAGSTERTSEGVSSARVTEQSPERALDPTPRLHARRPRLTALRGLGES